MNLQISPQTKREMIIFLIVAMGFIWLALSLENNYQNQRLEELKIEKQELEIRNEELFQIIYDGAISGSPKEKEFAELKYEPSSESVKIRYNNIAPIVDKKDSVSAELNRPECGEEVADTVSGEIKEISWYSELDSCHYPKDGKCLVASGKIADIGMVATWAYDIGTKLEIDGKIYTVEDRTNREYGHRIDVFTGYGDEAYQLAKANGIQYKKVKVLN